MLAETEALGAVARRRDVLLHEMKACFAAVAVMAVEARPRRKPPAICPWQ